MKDIFFTKFSKVDHKTLSYPGIYVKASSFASYDANIAALSSKEALNELHKIMSELSKQNKQIDKIILDHIGLFE